jgi:hypothetical protein
MHVHVYTNTQEILVILSNKQKSKEQMGKIYY